MIEDLDEYFRIMKMISLTKKRGFSHPHHCRPFVFWSCQPLRESLTVAIEKVFQQIVKASKPNIDTAHSITSISDRLKPTRLTRIVPGRFSWIRSMWKDHFITLIKPVITWVTQKWQSERTMNAPVTYHELLTKSKILRQ
jgi:hypothetical protein